MKNLLVNYDGTDVTFTEEGWFNATQAAAKFGKRVDHWLANQDTQEYISALEETNPSEVRDSNTRNSGYLKTRRGAAGGTWLHPALAVQFARWLDVKFAIWCDSQIRQLISGKHPHYDWKLAKHNASSSYKVFSAVLQMVRAEAGKSTEGKHYSYEAKMMNSVLTGEHKALDRSTLTYDELTLLAKIEERNTVYVGMGLDYRQRKERLKAYVEDLRIDQIKLQVMENRNDN